MNPPSGAPYYTPPPTPQSSSGGCWKAVGITCGVLFVLALIGVFFGVRAVKHAMSDRHSVFGQAMSLGVTTGNGIKIQQAVVQYHQKHGHYPRALTDLVADGLVDGKVLHSDLDPNPSPGHVSWRYTRPAEGAAGNTEILRLHFRLNMPTAANQPPPETDIIINLDGSTTQPARRRYAPSGYGAGRPSSGD